MPTRLLKPLNDFLRLEAAGGIVLMIASVVAMILANSSAAGIYESVLDLRLSFGLGNVVLAKPLLLWINDGLMAIFFFLVGMELKREIVEGHLSSLSRASLPAFAAVGGMVAPAAIYAWLNWHDATALRGWAIPTATDIAFALGVLTLLGKRVPTALKAFLLSIAIFDDLGAIIVIAIFYTASLSGLWLGIAAGLIALLALFNRAGVTRPATYVLVGVVLWFAVLKSGVHATLAGVVLAMFLPLRQSKPLEHSLHPWVAFGVLPIFALANAGVPLAGLTIADTLQPVPLGIVLGLFFGKQLGVMAFSWIATRLKLASLPEGVGWGSIYGVSLLCGIGFTMSLFIASLAFGQGEGEGLERLGILLGTLLSGFAGYIVLQGVLRKD